MKIKQHVVITDPAKFLRGDYSGMLLLDHPPLTASYVDCGEIELEFDVDTGKVRQIAMEDIETKLTAARVLLDMLESQKRDLLAIGYDAS